MNEYIIQIEKQKEYRLYEATDTSKRLIGVFYSKDEAEFHKSIRERVDNEKSVSTQTEGK